MFWSRICQSRNNKQCFGQEYVNLATIRNVFVNEYANLATISNVPRTKYITLGPKFFSSSKMAITRRIKHLHGWKKYSQNPLDEILRLSVANQDLEHFFLIGPRGFAGCFFNGPLSPEGDKVWLLQCKRKAKDKHQQQMLKSKSEKWKVIVRKSKVPNM